MPRTASLFFFFLLSISGLSTFAIATQSPSFKQPVDIQFGGDKIYALSDGQVSVPLSAYDGNPNAKTIINSILKSHYIVLGNQPSVLTALNTYFIQHKGKNILVDSGSGGLLPPKGDNGFLLQSLKSIHLNPAQIDIILLTHLHPDHIGGLLNAKGEKVFPNATLYLNMAEWNYWNNDSNKTNAPLFIKPWFDLAQKTIKAYHDHCHFFKDKKQKLLEGITAIPLPGHTPGHTGYLIKGPKDSELLIWGDIVHVGMFDFSHPEWSMVFDVNRTQATKEHIKVMGWCASKHILVAGMHLIYPGLGYVEKLKSSFVFKVKT